MSNNTARKTPSIATLIRDGYLQEHEAGDPNYVARAKMEWMDDYSAYLLDEIKSILSPRPIFLVITAYAIRASALSLHYAIEEMMASFHGDVSCGELVMREKSAGRILSMAIYARWSSIG